MDRTRDGPARSNSITGSSGYVVESVPLAILGASRVFSLGFQEILEELIMAGGDTDSTASMAGQMMGCIVGRAGIPQGMAIRVPCYDRIVELGSRLADIAGDPHLHMA